MCSKLLSLSESSNIIDVLLSKGGDFSEVYLENEALFSFIIENNKVKLFKTGTEYGVHLRVNIGDKTYSAYTSNSDYATLKVLAEGLAKAVGGDASTLSHPFKSNEKSLISSPISVESKGELLNHFLSMSEMAYGMSDLIKQASFSFYNTAKDIWIVNSLGQSLTEERKYARYSLNVVANDGNQTQTAYEGPALTGDFDVTGKYPVEETVERVVKRSLMMLSAQQAPSGKMPVILMGEAGGTMIHEACGHALEADFIYKDTSIFRGKLGAKIANEHVSVVDQGNIDGLFGSYQMDDEGVPAGKTELIKNGVLKHYMTDRLNAKLLDLPLTGNGRRESFRSKPVPRMSNTYIENGSHNPEDIVSSVQSGVLVKKMGGGQVNITNGDFVFEVSEGYKIENGKVTDPIRGASLIGSGPEVLEIIDMVGNDKDFMPGVCGKFDHVPVTDAQPTIRIPEIIIGGG